MTLAGLSLASCGGGGNDAAVVPGVGGSNPRLVAVEYGLLADVYGLRQTGNGATIELYQEDVLVGPDILDERPPGSTKLPSEVRWDFLSADPDTLQPRLLITREIGSSDFDTEFAALDDQLRRLQPAEFGPPATGRPFSVGARNAAYRLTFSHNLGITEDFFVQKNAGGVVTGVINPDAVQLLEITGDPTDPDPTGDFRPIPTRIIPRDNVLILDPVLLGSEGLQIQASNNASGLPESADQVSANIRVAIALEGALAIPGIRPATEGSLVGQNNSGQNSVIRDFRSGNRNDNTAEIRRGFLLDPLPLNLIGNILMYVESVDPGPTPDTKVMKVFKNGINHEIDSGDSFQLFESGSSELGGVTEVVEEPGDDEGDPTVQHVRVVVRRILGPNGEDVIEGLDPSNLPGYPSNEAEREPWLVANAPRAVLIAEFTAEKFDPRGNLTGDDATNFVVFTPRPLPKVVQGPSGPVTVPSDPGENVSPFAGAIVRFNKPVDLSTVKALDTLFFATRNLLDPVERANFQSSRGIDPNKFDEDKYRTPHLIVANVFDEDGSQTSLRLQPKLGFYLDESMRRSFGAGNSSDFDYFLHVLGGSDGIKDLSGNRLDFQAIVNPTDSLVFRFGLDLREDPATQKPFYDDNLVVSVARRFATPDEDEQPSYYLSSEVEDVGATVAEAFPLQDIFGSVSYVDGRLEGRQTSRVTRSVDDLNQQPVPPQEVIDPATGMEVPNPNRFCPFRWGNDEQTSSATAANVFNQPLQNPLNPQGCRLQSVWREIDMTLSRTNPADFNLDVEQMYWAPFRSNSIVFDEFDQVSLFLGHSEWRPEPCVGLVTALPAFGGSGLEDEFDSNYVRNVGLNRQRSGPARHTAYVDATQTIIASAAITDSTGTYRYLPLPTFQQPYFVWRDERVVEQGGNIKVGRDTETGRQPNFVPYFLSPFLGGLGQFSYSPGAGELPRLNNGSWDNRRNFRIRQTSTADDFTDGLVGAVGLPLLADFWTYPDSPTRPVSNPFLASGVNGWQVSLGLTSGARPDFRVYSAGGLLAGGEPVTVDPSTVSSAEGGYTPAGTRTPQDGDNTIFWVMADYLKRMTVATNGFIDVFDPHRIHFRPAGAMPGAPRSGPWPVAGANFDPRIGPYFIPDPSSPGAPGRLPDNVTPVFDWVFEPPLNQLPNGTSLAVEFRGAGPVDTQAWRFAQNNAFEGDAPDWVNVPLDPLKAGDAHIRKWDDRNFGAGVRRGWTHFYQRNVTDYTSDLNDLSDSAFTNQFAAPSETFAPQDIRYFNWRFIMSNNVNVTPAIAPAIESFSVTYRLEVN